MSGGDVFFTGWHYQCPDCDEDSTAASTIGYRTKAEAMKVLREHRRYECEGRTRHER